MIVHSTTSSPSAVSPCAWVHGPKPNMLTNTSNLLTSFRRHAAARRSPARIPSAGPIRQPLVLTA